MLLPHPLKGQLTVEEIQRTKQVDRLDVSRVDVGVESLDLGKALHECADGPLADSAPLPGLLNLNPYLVLQSKIDRAGAYSASAGDYKPGTITISPRTYKFKVIFPGRHLSMRNAGQLNVALFKQSIQIGGVKLLDDGLQSELLIKFGLVHRAPS